MLKNAVEELVKGFGEGETYWAMNYIKTWLLFAKEFGRGYQLWRSDEQPDHQMQQFEKSFMRVNTIFTIVQELLLRYVQKANRACKRALALEKDPQQMHKKRIVPNDKMQRLLSMPRGLLKKEQLWRWCHKCDEPSPNEILRQQKFEYFEALYFKNCHEVNFLCGKAHEVYSATMDLDCLFCAEEPFYAAELDEIMAILEFVYMELWSCATQVSVFEAVKVQSKSGSTTPSGGTVVEGEESSIGLLMTSSMSTACLFCHETFFNVQSSDWHSVTGLLDRTLQIHNSDSHMTESKVPSSRRSAIDVRNKLRRRPKSSWTKDEST